MPLLWHICILYNAIYIYIWMCICILSDKTINQYLHFLYLWNNCRHIVKYTVFLPAPCSFQQLIAEHFEHSLQIKTDIYTASSRYESHSHTACRCDNSSSLLSLLSNPFQALTGMKEQTQKERNRDRGSYF